MPMTDRGDATSVDRDVVVVGGGPAGLSAAAWLGRYRRDILVVDEHQQPSAPGVVAAGDVTSGRQLVTVAVGEGTIAGVSCALSLRVATKSAPVG
jgi:thioredoxin reductase